MEVALSVPLALLPMLAENAAGLGEELCVPPPSGAAAALPVATARKESVGSRLPLGRKLKDAAAVSVAAAGVGVDALKGGVAVGSGEGVKNAVVERAAL